MQPKVELNKIRSFGEILDDSILFIKQNWKPLLRAYFTICGLFWISGLIVSGINQLHSFQLIRQGQSIFNWLYFVTIFIELVTQTLLLIVSLSFVVLYKEKGNQPPSVEEVWAYVKYHFFRILGSYILLAIIVCIGFVFCFVPGIYFVPISAMVLTVMVIENAPLGYSFTRTFALIKENWWQTFGIMILSMLLVGITCMLVLIPALIIALIYVFMAGAHGYNSYMFAYSTAVHLAQVFYILPYIAVALVYYSLVERKEDHRLIQRIEALGTTDTALPDEPAHEEEY